MSRTALPSIAGQPVRVGVRLVALSQLDEATAARERMVHARDDEALHDFRVALRRLRSGLRAYRGYFDDTVRRTDRHELRDIARATGDARDIEVQLAWLESARLAEPATAGAGLLAEHLQSIRKPAERAAARAIHRFPDAASRLRHRLSRYTGTVDPAAPLRQETFAGVAAATAGAMLEELRAHLAAIASPDNARAAHDARITGKRLRYLLEPFRDDVENGRDTISLLRRLQDGLGELHDLDVMLALIASQTEALSGLGHAVERASLESLAREVRPARAKCLDRLRSKWLDGLGLEMYGQVEAFAAGLARLDSEPPVEIERKFLLRALPRRRKDRSVLHIDQGWLPGERLLERVRRIRGPEGTRWLRTVKLGYGLARTEIEEEIPESLFRSLWRLTQGRRIAKRRYLFRDGERVWEVDRFLDRDLVLAEIEMQSPAEEVKIPAWLEPCIVREVTGDRDYQNVNLAR